MLAGEYLIQSTATEQKGSAGQRMWLNKRTRYSKVTIHHERGMNDVKTHTGVVKIFTKIKNVNLMVA